MKNVFAALAMGLLAAPAMAEEVTLNDQEIKDLLTGATIKGIHYGVETRQYFADSGLTLWIKEGDAKPAEARYKVEDGKYCSSWTGLWNEEDYGCFSIAHDKEQNIYYFLQDNFRAPFVMNSGFDLNFN
ncbi:hypothetical protein [Ruegeria sp.]|uniref:hypothetical protein n=1 Tax=Ruegeria sp. TaxID=1879320 RepID=UPI00230E0F99|nr:hypothetical protein [Ruegeria sp.]MDA7965317.1 hypothetical protein [Ruegeria sp.]